MKGQKHLIQCHCVLPQYKNKADPVYHQFVVFSEIDDDGNVVPKNSQCNNCGSIHKIVGLCKSEIVTGKDEMSSLITIEDIKVCLPEKIKDVMESYEIDLPTWEKAQFIVDNEDWEDYVILAQEESDGGINGKLMRILSPTSARIEPFYRKIIIENS